MYWCRTTNTQQESNSGKGRRDNYALQPQGHFYFLVNKDSVLTFNISSWYNLIGIRQTNELSRRVNQAIKITGSPQSSLSELYIGAVIRKAEMITKYPPHSFQLLPSG